MIKETIDIVKKLDEKLEEINAKQLLMEKKLEKLNLPAKTKEKQKVISVS